MVIFHSYVSLPEGMWLLYRPWIPWWTRTAISWVLPPKVGIRPQRLGLFIGETLGMTRRGSQKKASLLTLFTYEMCTYNCIIYVYYQTMCVIYIHIYTHISNYPSHIIYIYIYIGYIMSHMYDHVPKMMIIFTFHSIVHGTPTCEKKWWHPSSILSRQVASKWEVQIWWRRCGGWWQRIYCFPSDVESWACSERSFFWADCWWFEKIVTKHAPPRKRKVNRSQNHGN